MVVGRAGGFAKRRQSVATSANRPTPRRAAAAQAAKPKQRKPPSQNRQQHPSPDPKSSEAEASSSSAPPTTRTASTSKAKLSSDSLLTGAAAAPIKRKDATVSRRSTDFSNIVLEAARRASSTTPGNRRGTDSSDIEAAGVGAGVNFEKIIRDRKSLLHRQPSIEEVAETESTVSVGSAFNLAKQHSLIENSPRRRRVTDISDYKTCALLMENMKVAGRGSPP